MPHDLRFIPTCVGNTTSMVPETPIRPVHPHVRGEYIVGQKFKQCFHGSSPRAWGILRRAVDGALQTRFIPTCVGNTWPGPCCDPLDSVHPHVRGEYLSEATNEEA